jgi:hypothetical protein
MNHHYTVASIAMVIGVVWVVIAVVLFRSPGGIMIGTGIFLFGLVINPPRLSLPHRKYNVD